MLIEFYNTNLFLIIFIAKHLGIVILLYHNYKFKYLWVIFQRFQNIENEIMIPEINVFLK